MTQESKLVASGGGTGRGRTWQEADTVCVEGEMRPPAGAPGGVKDGLVCLRTVGWRLRAGGHGSPARSVLTSPLPWSGDHLLQDRMDGDWEGADLSRGRKAEGAGCRPGQAGVMGVTSHPLLPPRCQKRSFMHILEQHVGISKQSLGTEGRRAFCCSSEHDDAGSFPLCFSFKQSLIRGEARGRRWPPWREGGGPDATRSAAAATATATQAGSPSTSPAFPATGSRGASTLFVSHACPPAAALSTERVCADTTSPPRQTANNPPLLSFPMTKRLSSPQSERQMKRVY